MFLQARRGAAARAPVKTAGKFELTEEQKQEIREAFDLFDTDGSGVCALCVVPCVVVGFYSCDAFHGRRFSVSCVVFFVKSLRL